MKKRQQLGLVAEGTSASSALLTLPKLGEHIGPIKSGSLRVARKLSNMLRTGYAVSDYKELDSAQTILIRVPDSNLGRIIDELGSSDLCMKDRSFVLCESWLPSDAIDSLSRSGASIATVMGFPRIRPDWFILEGQISAVRRVRRLLELDERQVAEIRPGNKHLYFAAELLATSRPMSILLGAQHALRESGLSGNKLSSLLQVMMQKLVREFARGVRSTMTSPRLDCSIELADRYMKALRADHPELAGLLEKRSDSSDR